MSKLIIISAPSSYGKSTLAKEIREKIHIDSGRNGGCYIFSTDNFWIRPNGTYDFNARMLEEAHQWTFDRFKHFVNDQDFNQTDVVVILDNTNLKYSEWEKYAELALRSKWNVEIQRVECNLTCEELAKRNTHRVPEQTIARQRSRWESKEKMEEQLSALKAKYGK